jgi:hypothetical protein
MDNFRRGLHSHAAVGTKTSLGVCIKKLKHQNKLNSVGTFLGPVKKSYVGLFCVVRAIMLKLVRQRPVHI